MTTLTVSAETSGSLELERGLKAPSVEVAGIIVRGLCLNPGFGARPLAAAVTDAPRSSPSRMR